MYIFLLLDYKGLSSRNRERFLDLSELLSESDEDEDFDMRDFRVKTGVKEEGVERQRFDPLE